MSAKKIGVLGCGMIAELGHLPALKHVAGINLHAVYDVSWNRALSMQAKFQIPHAFPTEKAFWESDIDAVVICTPAPFHLANVLQAAQYKKHVLCEKPLAMNEADITRMITTMDEAGLMLFTGFTYRFSGSAKEIHRLVRSGAIGEVRALRLNYLWNLHGKWNWNRKGERIASPLRVGRMLEGGPMVEMSFSYNATSREPRTHFQYELIGSDGVIRYNREEHSFELRNSHGTQWLAWHPEKNFVGMHWEFAHALSTGDLRDMPTAKDGLLATRIARLATEEAMRNRERTSQDHPSTMARAVNTVTSDVTSPLDLEEPDDLPPSTLSPLFERTKQ